MLEELAGWAGSLLSERMQGRLAKALPWIGTAIAVLTIFETVKRKGVVRGGVDSALNALPYVGTMKNVAESVRGRDFIAERAPALTSRR